MGLPDLTSPFNLMLCISLTVLTPRIEELGLKYAIVKKLTKIFEYNEVNLSQFNPREICV